MTPNVNTHEKPRGVLRARRLVLMATVAGLGGAALFSGLVPNGQTTLPGLTTPAFAQNVAGRPVGFADIVEKVKPAVISVRVKTETSPRMMGMDEDLPFERGSPMERFFKRFGGPDGFMPDGRRGPRGRQFGMSQGSGFFISPDGYAVTNNHVVERGQTVEVRTDDGKTYEAKVVGTDPRTDLALLKVEGRDDFPYVSLANHRPRIGDWVLAVGNPFGLGGTVTAGIVSAQGRDIGAGPYDDFIQIDAPVNKGNSGGPTFDVDGNVIGVNTAIFSPSGGNVGIAFAIPAETVRTVVAQLKEHGTVSRGWIGVQIQPVTKDIADSLGLKNAEGAIVAEPQDDSPAQKAGIKSGDVITSVNGEAVKDARDLARKIGAMQPGTTIKLGVFRDGSDKTLSLTLGELPNERQARAERGGNEDREEGAQSSDNAKLGLTLAPAGSVAGAGSEGVVITEVDTNGPAAERGFRTGDVILDVAGKAVKSPADVRQALAAARKDGKNSVLMRVRSGNGSKFVAGPLGRA
jgi:serine protease Do